MALSLFSSRMSEANVKGLLEDQVMTLIMENKMLRRQARTEEKVLEKGKEVNEGRRAWRTGEAVLTAR